MKSSEGLGNPINKWFNLGIINVLMTTSLPNGVKIRFDQEEKISRIIGSFFSKLSWTIFFKFVDKVTPNRENLAFTQLRS